MNVAQVGPLIPSSMTDAEERICAVGPFKTQQTILFNMLFHYDIHSGCGPCVDDLSGQNIVNCETKSKRSTFFVPQQKMWWWRRWWRCLQNAHRWKKTAFPSRLSVSPLARRGEVVSVTVVLLSHCMLPYRAMDSDKPVALAYCDSSVTATENIKWSKP